MSSSEGSVLRTWAGVIAEIRSRSASISSGGSWAPFIARGLESEGRPGSLTWTLIGPLRAVRFTGTMGSSGGGMGASTISPNRSSDVTKSWSSTREDLSFGLPLPVVIFPEAAGKTLWPIKRIA